MYGGDGRDPENHSGKIVANLSMNTFKMPKMYKIIHVIILQLILCTSVSATTYFVSPMGNNGNKGTSVETPFKVVQYTVDQMKSGNIQEWQTKRTEFNSNR